MVIVLVLAAAGRATSFVSSLVPMDASRAWAHARGTMPMTPALVLRPSGRAAGSTVMMAKKFDKKYDDAFDDFRTSGRCAFTAPVSSRHHGEWPVPWWPRQRRSVTPFCD
jgi:hypothetical protein